MKIKFYIYLCFLLVSTLGFGQVEFTAKAGKEKIALNERLKISFEMNADGDDFVPPDFKDFRIYAGPAQSISQSWTNGVRRFSKTYVFYLEPTKTGTLSIGQAEVNIDGTVYKTSPLQIEVTSAVEDPKDENDQQLRDETEGIHLVAEISKTSPYLNEGISIVYKLYVSPDAAISNWRFADIPKYSNFWSHDMEVKKDVKYGSYKGNKDYRYVELKRTVLYPQKDGELVIEPLTLAISVDVPTNRRDFFGRRLYESVEKTIASNSQTLQVKPLPQENRPADFSGAVGEFNISATASKNELEMDEALDVQVKVSGRGNLKLFQPPKLKVPNAFEAYNPERNESIRTDAAGSIGNISDTYTLVPNSAGEYKLDPISFSYFDPKSGSYKRVNTETLQISVTGGSGQNAIARNESDSGVQASYKQPISTGKHFLYIKLKTRLHSMDHSGFFKSNLFWSLLFSPIVLLPIVILAGKKQQEKAQDLIGGKLRNADRLARRYLSEAKKTLGDQNAYYEALERALYNFLKAKLNIPVSELTKTKISESLLSKSVDQEIVNDFISLLEACEFARYTPSTELGMQQDYDKAARIIAEVDKQLK